ncbi:MAG TPA: hypothetical protein VLA05_06305 [Coriobacteriia bacterium]|nr:hypothetical protein [Coriobacteriia bacterium]
MPDKKRLRLLSLLASLGELAERTGAPEDGVELLDQDTSYRMVSQSKAKPYGSITSLKHHGYQGEDQEQAHEDLTELIARGYVALTVMHDAYALTPTGLAVYHGDAEFH